MFRFAAFCFIPLSLALVMLGQSETATVTGRVVDPSQSVVADATVTALNESTGVAYRGKANGSGLYVITGLPPGLYRFEVERAGFQRTLRRNIVLHVQDAVELDFEMSVGSQTQTITVEGAAPLVNTEDAAVSTVVDQKFVDSVPLNGRSFQTLLTLTPGVTTTAASYTNQGQFSVNGQRNDANYFTVDGVSGNASMPGGAGLAQGATGSVPSLTLLGTTQSLVPIDAMLEFRIQTSSFAPEFGRSPGAQVSISTKSGTNQFHGTASDYLRNDVLDANNWFGDANRIPKPKERQNDFGATFGGPLVREKTFFFSHTKGLG